MLTKILSALALALALPTLSFAEAALILGVVGMLLGGAGPFVMRW